MRNFAIVNFPTNDTEYTFCTDLNLEAGDQVVVETRHGFRVATVIKTRGLTKDQMTRAYKWVVQKIDIDRHEARMAQEEVKQEIRNKLQQRKEEMEEILIYQRLAAEDSEIAGLLEELSKLEGQPLAFPTQDVNSSKE
jgi:hypothetical protein